jgi:ring-1,2-phenylacetyl-CoA epoxidase subunit PaaD
MTNSAPRTMVPSPLTPEACLRHDVGEGQGGGDCRTLAVAAPPTPSPSPQGGGETPGVAVGDLEIVRAYSIAAAVVDPEIPVLTLEDLGVLRGVERHKGRIVVKLTPTYTGCPATLAIQLATQAALAEAGFADAEVETVLSPPWSTDDITEEGRRKLKEFGIAPPARGARARSLFAEETVACPRCGSTATAKISEFGSTACKALWRCESCAEPFDYFKCL